MLLEIFICKPCRSGTAFLCQHIIPRHFIDIGNIKMVEPTWNSLELVKIIVSSATPLLLLILGIKINNTIKRAERSTQLRSDIYKDIGADLNDIYAYLNFVGSWKELTPLEIIKKKRSIDKTMYTYKPFFTSDLFEKYNRFMSEAFSIYQFAGSNARIRSKITTHNGDRKMHTVGWDSSWETCFTDERNEQAQRVAYDDFLKQLALDLGL